ncbi:hypothetical protein OIV83_001713 [Microbotryomycetes sp. JL201]|nr:hypothetical protein OIV83_001713 [Microbotryomycetes sp. JL201]
MPKAQRHRKRVRAARLDATAQPLGASSTSAEAPSAAETTIDVQQGTSKKKQGKKEAEVANLLDKLRSDDVKDRQWAASTLANVFLTLPAVTQRLLLSKNLIGLLIERLADSDETVTVEALGALRNLAVASPPSIVSEMHNKRVLLPLMQTHVPLLTFKLQHQLEPAPEPIQAPLPSTAEQRKHASETNAQNDLHRRIFWDWSENVLTLLWCLSESTTKILTSLNAHGDKIVDFAMSFLNEHALDIASAAKAPVENGMTLDGKHGKKNKKADKREREPLFVAVAAAQLVHAFTAQNPAAQSHLLRNPNFTSLSSILRASSPPTSRAARTEQHAASDATTDSEDFLQLRVLAFGILLQVSKTGKSAAKHQIRALLKDNQSVLMQLLETDLNTVASTSVEIHKSMDPKIADQPGMATTGQALRLTSIERQLSTLQLSLEVLGEWCALIEAEGLGLEQNEDEEEEEWGGIIDGDVEMDEDEADVPADGIFRKQHPDDSADDGMVDDDVNLIDAEISTSAIALFSKLPGLLLAFAHPTPLSFLQASSATVSAPSTLISTENGSNAAPAQSEPVVPEALSAISDILTTIHVRALECLNNLYITLARASAVPSAASFFDDKKQVDELQRVWQGVLNLVQGAASAYTGAAVTREDEMDELDQRRMEVVSAGVGAVWGMSRIGIDHGRRLDVGADTSAFLVSLFSHPFASIATPAGESIRVRIVGALGWIGRRSGVPVAENEAIGSFLLSVMPRDKAASTFNLTIEVLLQVVDSFIDLYSDEESAWDQAVFRAKQFLPALQSVVPGTRAAVRKVDRKRFPELRHRADGVLENLVEFVKYRHGVA